MKKSFTTIAFALALTIAAPRPAEAGVLGALGGVILPYIGGKLLDELFCYSDSCQQKQKEMQEELRKESKLREIYDSFESTVNNNCGVVKARAKIVEKSEYNCEEEFNQCKKISSKDFCKNKRNSCKSTIKAFKNEVKLFRKNCDKNDKYCSDKFIDYNAPIENWCTDVGKERFQYEIDQSIPNTNKEILIACEYPIKNYSYCLGDVSKHSPFLGAPTDDVKKSCEQTYQAVISCFNSPVNY